MDADASLHGCIYGIFRKIYPIAVTISYVLNSYNSSYLLDRIDSILRKGSAAPHRS